MSDELARFRKELLQDISAIQLSEDEGGSAEQIFTHTACNLLIDAGETENVRIAYDEGQLRTRNQHKINGYGEPDNYETVDLFITIYKGTRDTQSISKDEIDTAAKRITNFYSKARHKNYLNDIEETSEIWEFTRTIANLETLHENLVRINAIILTDGLYSGKIPGNVTISSCPIYFRVVDLNYLYNITKKSHVPIEIDFVEEGFEIPCIPASSKNDLYQSYMAIMPGRALANIYERFGSRLLEQNVRSFLQFTGKVNKGIRQTIIDEPEMFLAFNNGIAATAESVEIKQSNNGLVISSVEDFQIVNGGQTTASIYHTAKKDKANIDKIFVQVKLSIIKAKSRHSEIVSRIAEYSNTQNKVAFSELSSNIPFHVEVEKLSRSIVTPYVEGDTVQTKWFYERARGQYKNARMREGFTTAKRKAFDRKNPRSQVFTKGDLAKFVNVFIEVQKNKKTVIGPHIVVRGNEKNYVEFIKHNLIEKPDNVYFEDLIAKAILYKSAEKIYGVKPNALGDLRYITVPYALAWLGHQTDGRIDLLKIWKNQAISDEMKNLLRELMVKLEKYLKTVATGSLYGEFAKKQDCWDLIKKQNFDLSVDKILKRDFIDMSRQVVRRRLEDSEIDRSLIEDEILMIREVPERTWKRIGEWGRSAGELSSQELTTVMYLPNILRKKAALDEGTRKDALGILNKVIEKAPELFEEVFSDPPNEDKFILMVKSLLSWNTKNRILRTEDVKFLEDLANRKKNATNSAVLTATMIAKTAGKKGFQN